ncbi:hypothetical protein [Streptomyces albicerus]|nr:hypothetical protein [Streptomyces albicerus]
MSSAPDDTAQREDDTDAGATAGHSVNLGVPSTPSPMDLDTLRF